MPEGLASLMTYIYDERDVWMSADRTLAREPITPTSGVLQGCPFSMITLIAETSLAAKCIHKQVIAETALDDGPKAYTWRSSS